MLGCATIAHGAALCKPVRPSVACNRQLHKGIYIPRADRLERLWQIRDFRVGEELTMLYDLAFQNGRNELQSNALVLVVEQVHGRHVGDVKKGEYLHSFYGGYFPQRPIASSLRRLRKI